jgi:hypothetical protein
MLELTPQFREQSRPLYNFGVQNLEGHSLVAIGSVEAILIDSREYRSHSALPQQPLHAVAASQYIAHGK